MQESRLLRILKKYYFLKLCVNRSNSYVSLPMGIFKDFLLVSMWLKLNYNVSNYTLILPIFAGYFGLIVLWGYIDIKKKFAHIEMSINNKINPEIQTILKNTKK